MTKPDILIIGGTGKIGAELVSVLIKTGIHFRILVRHNSTGHLPQYNNCEIVRGDLTESENLKIALSDIKRVFLLSRDQPRLGELEGNLIELARTAGVMKIVKSSAFAAGLQPPVGYGVSHAESEQKLMTCGLQWVILRPYMFMQNLLELSDLIMSRSLMPLPLAKAKIGLIDARDVALVAKTVLTEDVYNNKLYELTGPDALSMNDCAEILSEVLGRSIRYRSPPYWFAALIMRMQGVSVWDIAMRKQLFKMIRDGGETKITNDVENITGQKPRSFEIFLRENQNVFKQ